MIHKRTVFMCFLYHPCNILYNVITKLLLNTLDIVNVIPLGMRGNVGYTRMYHMVMH